MSRCLILTHLFPPAGGVAGRRMGALARHLRSRGWAITVVTSAAEPRRDDPDVLEVGGVPGVDRIPHEREHGAGWLYRLLKTHVAVPDRHVIWSGRAGRTALSASSRRPFDVIVASAPPLSILLEALRLSGGTRTPLVVDFRDGWLTDPHRRAYYRSRWRRRREISMERRVVEGAARVLVTSDGWAREFGERFPHLGLDHFVSVPNGHDPEEMASAAVPRLESGTGVNLVHTGTFAGEQTARPVFEALASIRDRLRGRLRLLLVGAESHWSRVAAEMGVGSLVSVVPRVPVAQALGYQRAADALLLVLTSDPRPSSPVYPAKIFEYVGANRPVLAVLPAGDADAFLRQAGRCRIVRPDDGPGLARALLDAADGLGFSEPAATRGAILDASTWRARASRMETVLSSVAGERSREESG